MQPYKPMEEEGSPTEGAPQGGQPATAQPLTVASPPRQVPSNQMQSPQVLLVVPSSQMDSPINNKKAKIFLGMGSVQLIIGILEVVFNIGATAMWVETSSFVGPGYWCGLFAMLAGSFGIAVGKTKGKGMVVTFMVLSIIAAVVTVGIIATAAVGVAVSPDSYYSYSYYDDINPDGYNYRKRKVDTSIALNSLLLIAGVSELIIAIVSSAFCCGALCGQPQQNMMYPGVQYLNGAQHLNVNGQVVTATNWFPPPTQATVPVQTLRVQQPMILGQQPMMIPQQPAYVATNSPPPSYGSNQQ